MSWQEVTYRLVRCDGDTPQGQCPAVLPDPQQPTPARNVDGQHVCLPAVFVGTAGAPLPTGIEFELGVRWLIMPDRALCPEHIQAAEYLMAAELDGLPFDEQDGGDSRG